MGMSRSVVVAFILATTTTACTTVSELQVGPVVALPTKEDASFGGAAAVHSALSPGDEARGRSIVGYDVNAKLKATSQTQHMAFGNGFLYARSIGASSEALMRGGLHLAFEHFDDKLIVGGGPYATLMGGIALDDTTYFVPGHIFSHWQRDRTLLTFGPITEIDARFSRPSAIVFVGIGFGIAWVSEVVPPPP
jgi:hypothetical protein